MNDALDAAGKKVISKGQGGDNRNNAATSSNREDVTGKRTGGAEDGVG